MKRVSRFFLTCMGIVAVAGIVLTANLVETFAASDKICKNYAKRAVDQQKENLRRRCGLRGRKWSNNSRGHYNWCRGVASGVAWGETLNRMNALGLCRPGGGGGGGSAINKRCSRYAETAVRQNLTNRRNNCGYSGNRWTSNRSGHYNWCRGVNPSVASSETLARGRELKRCLNRASACRWRNIAFGQRECVCVFVNKPNVTQRVHPKYCRGLR